MDDLKGVEAMWILDVLFWLFGLLVLLSGLVIIAYLFGRSVQR